MRKLRKQTAFVLAVMMFMLLLPFTADENGGQALAFTPPTGITISPPSMSLLEGTSGSFTALVVPSDADQGVQWDSDDPLVASVDGGGNIIAHSAGTATISVTTADGNFTASATVTVTGVVAVAGVSINPAGPFSIPVGGTQSLTPVFSPPAPTNLNVTWTSSDTSVATVSATGHVTGVAVGPATITVTTQCGPFSASVNITVTAVPVMGVAIAQSSPVALVLGTTPTATLNANFTPTNATNREVTWTSNSPAIATVSPTTGTGPVTVTAVAVGSAIITATAADTSNGVFTATVTVNVTAGATGITIAPSPGGGIILNRTGAGNTQTLTATTTPAGQPVTWSLHAVGTGSGVNTDAVTISGTAVGPPATTTITAVNAVHYPVQVRATTGTGANAQTANVYVWTSSGNVASVAITGGNQTIGSGATLNLAATVTPRAGHTVDQRVTWYSSNTSVATVNRITGVVTATAGAAGRTTTITARSIDGGVSATAVLTTSDVASIAITHTGPGGGATTGNVILPRTGTNNYRTLTATTVPAGQAITWSVESVGTGAGTGAITISQPSGAAQNVRRVTANDATHFPVRVVAASGGQRATVYVWTSSGAINSVQVNASNHGMAPSTHAYLSASVLPIGSEQRVTWYSSNTAVVTVDRISGRVTSTAGDTSRTAIITARSIDGGVVSPGVTITVAPSPVTGVNITPSGNFTLESGETRQLTANVLPTNVAEHYRAVTWRSLNTAVATVSATGLVTAVSNGTAVIEVLTTTGQRAARLTVTVSGRVPVTGITFPDIPGNSLNLPAGQSRTLTPIIAPANATNRTVTWHSNNTSVASVTTGGVLSANAAGVATITVTSQDNTNIRAYLTITVTQAQLPAGMFTDVRAGTWYASYVERVVNAGLFSGVGGGLFNPEGTMTRAMFAVVIARYDRADVAAFVPTFSDVARNEWYSAEIAWAAANGIIHGLGGNEFGPYNPVTREQMAVMIYRYVYGRGIQLPIRHTPTAFVDSASISDWAAEAVVAMQMAGIIQGDAQGRFNPQQSATRAQVAAIFSRLLDIVPR